MEGMAMPPNAVRLLEDIEVVSEQEHERVLSPALSSNMQTESGAVYMLQL